MNVADILVSTLIFVFPAYCANAAPVIFGGGRPLDGGMRFLDGKPILGPHKTVRGTLVGLVSGVLATIFMTHYLLYDLEVGLALSIGAVIGDLTGSFIKRRLNIPPGRAFPFLDQLSFIVVAMIFAYFVSSIKPIIVLTTLAVTPVIHLLTNLAAYHLGIKETPF